MVPERADHRTIKGVEVEPKRTELGRKEIAWTSIKVAMTVGNLIKGIDPVVYYRVYHLIAR